MCTGTQYCSLVALRIGSRSVVSVEIMDSGPSAERKWQIIREANLARGVELLFVHILLLFYFAPTRHTLKCSEA